jgi:hypothetical protein
MFKGWGPKKRATVDVERSYFCTVNERFVLANAAGEDGLKSCSPSHTTPMYSAPRHIFTEKGRADPRVHVIPDVMSPRDVIVVGAPLAGIDTRYMFLSYRLTT